MKKTFRYVLLTVLVLVLVVYVGATFFLGSAIKAGVNRVGPKLTQTNVVLEGASVSPLTGSGTLTGLSVDNPAGWTTGRAFYLGRMHVAMKPLSVLGDHIVINEIQIDQAEFRYETNLLASNFNDLVKNIEAAVGGRDSKTEPASSDEKPRKIEVRHFLLTNGKITLGMGQNTLPLNMPTIELKDLGTAEGGLTPAQLSIAVMKSLTSAAVSAAAHSPGTAAGAAAIESVKKTGEEIKKLFGGGK